MSDEESEAEETADEIEQVCILLVFRLVFTDIGKDGECNTGFEKEGSNCKGARQ